MKKLIVSSLATAVVSLAAYGQGTVSMLNINAAAGVNAPVYDGVATTVKLAGANYQAGLYAGLSSTSLSYVGNSTPFLSAGGAGYFNGGTTVLSTIAPGTSAFVQVWAWDTTLGGTTTGATLAQAQAAFLTGGKTDVVGWSDIIPIVPANPNSSPPGTPTALVGLTSFELQVPEPSTMALAGLGAAALLIFRRRK